MNPLTWYEYILIVFPFFLGIFGGFIGAIIGSATLFTNSILFRKINNKIFRYSMAVINTLIALLIFFRVVVYITPFITELQFKVSVKSEAVKNDPMLSSLTTHIWETYKLIDSNNEDISSQAGALIGCKRYFFGNGDYTQVLKNGSFLKGTWKVDEGEKFISFTGIGEKERIEILRISNDELVVKYRGVKIYNKAI